MIKHWRQQIKEAKQYGEGGNFKESHRVLRSIYEANLLNYDPVLHTEESAYIIEKVDFLVMLADMSLKVGYKEKMSLPYIDEAIILTEKLEEIPSATYKKELEILRETLFLNASSVKVSEK